VASTVAAVKPIARIPIANLFIIFPFPLPLWVSFNTVIAARLRHTTVSGAPMAGVKSRVAERKSWIACLVPVYNPGVVHTFSLHFLMNTLLAEK
jgi:hypothetical protein